MIQLCKILAVCLLSLSGYAHGDALRLSDPVQSDETSETFGALLNQELPRLSLSEAVTAEWVGKSVLIESRVGQVCKMKGCFFMAMEGTLSVRVSFEDYSFFIPTDSGDKTVTLAGKVVKRELTPEQVAHFQKDAGDSTLAIEAGEVFEIVASSVRIPKTQT